jgi:hypothetical protein
VRTTMLPGTTVPTSALGLGMGDLFRLPQRADRLRILAAAHDAGIVHIDTAPMYGLGAAEAELGRFARGRRDQLVIVTKFGITPTLVARALSVVQGPIRLQATTPAPPVPACMPACAPFAPTTSICSCCTNRIRGTSARPTSAHSSSKYAARAWSGHGGLPGSPAAPARWLHSSAPTRCCRCATTSSRG